MKLLDRVAETAARRDLSPLTVECYQRWIRDFLAYWAAPREEGEGRQERGEKDGAVRHGGAGVSRGTAVDEVEGDQPGAEVDIAAGLLLDEPEVPPSKLNWRRPHELGAAEVAAFLTYLAIERRLSASSQNQATNAKIMGFGNLALGVWVSPSLWI